MYENQKFWFKSPVINVITQVCKRRIRPKDMGCFIKIKINENIKINIINKKKISGNSLLK